MSRRIILGAVVLASLTGCAEDEGANFDEPSVDSVKQEMMGNPYKRIRKTDTQLCVDIKNYSTPYDGQPVQTWGCNGTTAQQWLINSSDFTIKSVNNRCLDVYFSGTANNTPVRLSTCNGTGAQKWVRYGSSLYNPQSGKCLDVNYNSSDWGTELQIYDCNGNPSQSWVIENTPAS